MDRLIASNSVPFAGRDLAPSTGTPQYATSGDPNSNIAATVWPAYAFNALQDELIAVIEAAGLTPDRDDWGQLQQAISLNRGGSTLFVSSAAGTTDFVVPAGVYRIFGECQGSGGSGAGVGASSSGGAGGAGGYAAGWFSVEPGDHISLVVGAGAAATAAGDDGATGASSSIGAFMSAPGGGGGQIVASSAGGDGTVGVDGEYAFWGGGGGDGSALDDAAPGGIGGASFFGGASRDTIGGGPGAPGSGGRGGYTFTVDTEPGGPGSDGAIILRG